MAAGHHDGHQGTGYGKPGETGMNGTLVQGRYRLHELIGRGGMGEVWRALDESLGRRVAVKCLKPSAPSGDAGFTRILQARFRREARVAAALQHRGITVVHDFGEHDGVLYLVMELLDGRNLLQILEDTGRSPLPVPDITDIAEQVAAALAYTHAQGVVHRDLKPANIIRLTDGAVKICDFGIARLGHDIGFTSRLTGSGVAMGTPHYMSPEQIDASEVDHRSDLYSLGCVLYELATGAPPFDLGDTWSILVGHRDTEPEPPRATRPELPVELERLILDLLAKDPEHRPQDAADVGGRLKAMRAAAGVTASTAVPAELPAWARSVGTGSAARSTRAHRITAPAHQELTAAWSIRTVEAGPDTLAALAARDAEAIDLGRVGNWQQAYELHTSVAAARDRALGPEHPDTLASRYEAAYCLTRLGRPEEALRLYEYVAEARRRVLGPDEPDTLAARHETAYELGRLGRHLEAHQEYSAVLAARERTIGSADTETLRARHALGVTLGLLGQWDRALAEARDVAAIRERMLGPTDPDTLVSKREIAVGLGWLGRWSGALTVYHDVAEVRERVLGPDHPDTLTSRADEARCLARLGRTAEAQALQRWVEDQQSEGPGPL
jgi:tetratricopeptide (TPR) repeat protein